MLLANGATDVTTYFMLYDSTNHEPKTDITITDIDLYYIEEREAMAAKVDATALAAADSAHAANKAFHVGLGLYRVDWPDAAFDGGAGTKVNLIVVCAGVDTSILEVELSVSVGAVASVTGAVGSVTGNVGGNVTGSVGSVAGNVGGNVVGTVASVTGNVDGSVASVVGAVGSVTGAVGSVTGSVGSVTGAVGSVAGNVDGNVTGSVGSLAAQAEIDVRTAIGMASANLDVQISNIPDGSKWYNQNR